MDDILSILIYIIVIISFLSSLFKKKTPDTPTQPQRQTRPDIERTSTVSKSDEYDLMREIENMFKTESQKAEEDLSRTINAEERQTDLKPSSEHVSYEQYAGSDEAVRSKNKSEYIRDYSEQQATQSEHQYTETKKPKVKIDKRTEQKAKEFQALLERKSVKQVSPVSDILRKIKNPSTFREYILVSEIIARPKALRR